MSKLKTTTTPTTPKTKFKNELVLRLEQQIQITKLEKQQLPDTHWDNDIKHELNIFYAGKISAFQMVMNEMLYQIK